MILKLLLLATIASAKSPSKFEILNARLDKIEKLLVQTEKQNRERRDKIRLFNKCSNTCADKFNWNNRPVVKFNDADYTDQDRALNEEFNDQRMKCQDKCKLPDDEIGAY